VLVGIERFPEATRACEHEAVWLDEAVFRAGAKGVDDAVSAIKKIQQKAKELSAAMTARVIITPAGMITHQFFSLRRYR